jgi:hypothetical protein
MRIRSIKPSFWRSLSMSKLPLQTRHHFIGLWGVADDEGRAIEDPRLLKGDLWSLDPRVSSRQIGTMQVELAAAGKLWRYTDGEKTYFEIVNWKDHQKINHPQKSSLPAHDDPSVDPLDEPSPRTLFPDDSGTLPVTALESSRNGPGTLQPGSGSGSGSGVGKREEGRGKELATPSRRDRDPAFLGLCEVEGSVYDELDSDGRKTIAVALAKIRRASPDVDEREILRRSEIYHEVMPPGTMLTAPALAKHWAKLSVKPATRTGVRDRAAEIMREAAADARG